MMTNREDFQGNAQVVHKLYGEAIAKLNDQAATITQLQLDNTKLREALAKVIKISDRQHDAWDSAKDLLSTTSQPESQPESVIKESLTAQKLLSDEEIIAIDNATNDLMEFARAIEKHHGIE